MSQITAIEPQKKKAQRFNIFLDGRFAFGISDINLLKNNLKIGKKLTEEGISKIIAREEITKLMDIATNYLGYRPRSEKEIVDHLAKKIADRENIKFQQAQESPLISKVVSSLKKYKYINDLEFAKWYVESRLGSKPRGLILIKIELKRKGISPEIIEKVVSFQKDELSLAQKAVKKKLKRWQNLSSLDLKKKVYQYLSSRGFDFDTIKETFAYISKKG